MHGKYEFEATVFASEMVSDDVLVISFLKDQDASEYVNIHFSKELDEDDIAFGWSKYYLEFPYGAGAYSCLERVIFTPKSLKLILNASGQKWFGISEAEIMLELSNEDFLEAKASIAQIFEDEASISFQISA